MMFDRGVAAKLPQVVPTTPRCSAATPSKKGWWLAGLLLVLALWAVPDASAVCNVAGDCTCSYTNSPGTMYYLPNGSNQSVTCSLNCIDTDGSCATMGTCRLSIQESFAGAASTLDTGPLEGTSTQAAFCGGQSCISGNLPGSGPTFTRNVSVVRTNTTGSSFKLRCNSEHPGAGASSWGTVFVYSPGNPNMTSFKWYDASYPYVNGTNQSERLEGNRTCFESVINSDATISNVSLWANFSSNGSNSTTFRLIDTNVSAGLANSTARVCVNLTNGLDGTNSWNNVSVALCANTNTTTGAVTRYGMSCKSLRGPTWITSGTSMTTANAAGTFNWFNVSWPNAAASSPCAPTGAWTVAVTLTCTNVNITVDLLNVTELGSLTLRNVTFRVGNVYVTDSGPLGGKGRLSYENTTFDGSQAWWLNGNLTIAGRVNLSGITLYLNSTDDGSTGINLTNTGFLWIGGNSSNITAGETTTNGYFFWIDSGSNFSIRDTAIYYSGYSGFRYGRGLTINTTAVNFTRVKIYDSSYVGITILEGANGTNYTATDISRASDATLQLRYVKELNFSQHNSTKSGGGPSLVMDGMVIEHANMSGNTGDALGGNGVQNVTLIDVNMSGGSQSGIGIVNLKNLTVISSNITGNAWHGVSGYTMNGVYIHDTNTSGNGQSGIGINYDQLTAMTTSNSNFVLAYNTTITDTIAFQGSVNLTAWNTTTNTVLYGTCTICNLTVRWPLSLYLTDDWGGLLKNAHVALVSKDLRENLTNTTGAAAFIRHLNVTEYARYAANTYVWVSNYSINATQTNYSNRTMSLNVSGPNETTINLTYDPCVVPQDNWTLPQWTIPMANNCEVTHQHRTGKLDSITLSGSGNVTFTDSNFSMLQLNWTPDLSRPRNITMQTGSYFHVGGTGT